MDTNEEVRVWLNEVLEENFTTLDHSTLKDGTVLVRLVNKTLNKNYKYVVPVPRFKNNEYIEIFIKESRTIGVPQYEIFETTDLINEKNFKNIERGIIAFSRYLSKADPNFRVIGPNLTEKKKFNFSEEQLREAQVQETLFSAMARTAPKASLFNAPRQVIDDRITGPQSAAPEDANQ